jgi:hypothetical protein
MYAKQRDRAARRRQMADELRSKRLAAAATPWDVACVEWDSIRSRAAKLPREDLDRAGELLIAALRQVRGQLPGGDGR